jgi:hypothetical protein
MSLATSTKKRNPAFRTLHSALERLFSGIHFGMDDGDNWRLDFCRAKGAKAAKSVGLASL